MTNHDLIRQQARTIARQQQRIAQLTGGTMSGLPKEHRGRDPRELTAAELQSELIRKINQGESGRANAAWFKGFFSIMIELEKRGIVYSVDGYAIYPDDFDPDSKERKP